MVQEQEKIMLSPEQQIAHDRFIGGREKYTLLTGWAGTGKTTCVVQIVKSLRARRPGIRITMCAPTHRAVFIMRRMAIEQGIADVVDFSTVHALLNMKAVRDDDTGEETFVKSDFGDKDILEETDVLIVDEVSMIGDLGPPKGKYKKRVDGEGLFTLLMAELEGLHKLRVLFVGDKQIPPVGEADTKLFYPFIQQKYGFVSLELTEPQRQALDSPILCYANEWRKSEGMAKPPPELCVTGEQARALMEQLYRSREYAAGDTDHVKTLCWRNTTVDYCNEMVREIIYGDEAKQHPVMTGERLILDRQWSYKPDRADGPKKEMIPTNTEMIVQDVKYWRDIFKVQAAFGDYAREYDMDLQVLHCKVEMLKVVRGEVIPYTLMMPLLHPNSRKRWHDTCELLAKDAKNCSSVNRKTAWNRYYSLYDRYAHYKYNYAQTCHKAQGGSYGHAIVNAWDIEVNQKKGKAEMVRIMYVALSRPKKGLYIIQ